MNGAGVAILGGVLLLWGHAQIEAARRLDPQAKRVSFWVLGTIGLSFIAGGVLALLVP